MTRKEFATTMAYLAAACGKSLPDASMEVYYDLLGDLPMDALKTAAKRVSLEHKWATFPSVAELREAAAETMQGHVKGVSPAEAWEMAWDVAGRFDPDQHGEYVSNGKTYPSQWALLTSHLPPVVLKAINAFGIMALIYGKEPIGVIRAQFMKCFEQIDAKQKRAALLPASLRQEIESHGRASIPAPVQQVLTDLGKEPA